MTQFIFDSATNTWYSLGDNATVEAVDPMDIDPNAIMWLAGFTCQVHKAPMPIKQPKQAAKAIIFAIEDSLGSDLDSNHIHYLGREDGIGYAAAVNHDEMLKLQEFGIKQIYPLALAKFEKSSSNDQVDVITFNNVCYVQGKGHESYAITEGLLVLTLEKLLKESPDRAVVIHELTSISELTKVNLANLTENVHYETARPPERPSAGLGLLSGPYKVIEPKKKKSQSKFKPLYALAAVFLVVILAGKYIKAQQYQAMAKATNDASVEFFKQTFPGERPVVKGLKRQFDDLAGTNSASHSGVRFTDLFASTAKEIKADPKLEITSVRFNDKNSSIEYSITSESIAQLEKLKAGLERKNISMEIASANQSGGKIKGLIKVSPNV